jgi:hypothetical protein
MSNTAIVMGGIVVVGLLWDLLMFAALVALASEAVHLAARRRRPATPARRRAWRRRPRTFRGRGSLPTSADVAMPGAAAAGRTP